MGPPRPGTSRRSGALGSFLGFRIIIGFRIEASRISGLGFGALEVQGSRFRVGGFKF